MSAKTEAPDAPAVSRPGHRQTDPSKNRRKIARDRFGVPKKGPDPSQKQSKPRRIAYTSTTGISLRTFLKAALDGRSVVTKMVRERAAVFAAQLGNDMTPAQDRIVQQVARLSILSDSTWAAVQQKGLLNDDGARTNALDTFLKVARAEREALNAIGLERRQKPLPDLGTYLASKTVPEGDAE